MPSLPTVNTITRCLQPLCESRPDYRDFPSDTARPSHYGLQKSIDGASKDDDFGMTIAIRVSGGNVERIELKVGSLTNTNLVQKLHLARIICCNSFVSKFYINLYCYDTVVQL
jgi:hypothetical protein